MDILTYILLGVLALVLIVCLSIASFADSQLLEVFKETNNIMSSSFTVASDFSAMASRAFLDGGVKVGNKQGFLTDAYSPNDKRRFFCLNKFITIHQLLPLPLLGMRWGTPFKTN